MESLGKIQNFCTRISEYDEFRPGICDSQVPIGKFKYGVSLQLNQFSHGDSFQ